MERPLVNRSSALFGQDDNILTEIHFSETKQPMLGLNMDGLTDGDANHYIISPPPVL